MAGIEFQVSYDGRGMSNHAMDAHLLGPALLGLGELVLEANATLNREHSKVRLLVKSDFEHKCFNIHFELVQTLYQYVKDLISDQDVKTAKEIAEWIGLVGGAAGISLLGYLRARRGQEIKKVTKFEHADGRGTVKVEFKGDGNIVIVNQNVFNLSENAKIKQSVERIM